MDKKLVSGGHLEVRAMASSTVRKGKSFYKRFALISLAGTFLLMILVSVGTFFVYFSYYTRTLADYSLQNANYVRANLQARLSEITAITDQMYLDRDIQQILTTPLQASRNQADFLNYCRGQETLLTDQVVGQLNLFDLYDNHYIYFGSAVQAQNYLSGLQVRRTPWFQNAMQTDGRITWLDGRSVDPSVDHLLLAVRLIKNATSNTTLGTCVITVRKRAVADALSPYVSQTTRIYLADPAGQIVLVQDPLDSWYKEGDTVLDITRTDGQEQGYYHSLSAHQLTVFQHDSQTGWYVVQVTSTPTFPEFLRQMIGPSLLFFALACGLAGAFAFYLYNRLSAPIFSLVSAMRTANPLQDDLPCLDGERDDEIGYLNRGYLMMLGETRRLFSHLLQEQQAKKNAELQALRMQINPHFLYNTLTVVRYLIDMKQNQNASQVLISLIKLLKINLDPARVRLTVAEELEYLRNYLLIQQYRYDNFQVSYQIDPSARNCLIPRLLIQPLVENSLFHGLNGGQLPGHIQISIQRRGALLHVCVQDDGCGFPPDFSLQHIGQNTARGAASIGLSNVDARLKLQFGPLGGLQIDSLPGKGASVSFSIPIQEEP